jgi:hypothetical protein
VFDIMTANTGRTSTPGKLYVLACAVLFDAVMALSLLLWILLPSGDRGPIQQKYRYHAILLALAVLGAVRVGGIVIALLYSYAVLPISNLDRQTVVHEEGWEAALKRCLWHPCLVGEVPIVLSMVAAVASSVRCFIPDDQHSPFPPVFWLVVDLTAMFSIMEGIYLRPACQAAERYGTDSCASLSSPLLPTSLSLPVLEPLYDENGEAVVEQQQHNMNDGGSNDAAVHIAAVWAIEGAETPIVRDSGGAADLWTLQEPQQVTCPAQVVADRERELMQLTLLCSSD